MIKFHSFASLQIVKLVPQALFPAKCSLLSQFIPFARSHFQRLENIIQIEIVPAKNWQNTFKYIKNKKQILNIFPKLPSSSWELSNDNIIQSHQGKSFQIISITYLLVFQIRINFSYEILWNSKSVKYTKCDFLAYSIESWPLYLNFWFIRYDCWSFANLFNLLFN